MVRRIIKSSQSTKHVFKIRINYTFGRALPNFRFPWTSRCRRADGNEPQSHQKIQFNDTELIRKCRLFPLTTLPLLRHRIGWWRWRALTYCPLIKRWVCYHGHTILTRVLCNTPSDVASEYNSFVTGFQRESSPAGTLINSGRISSKRGKFSEPADYVTILLVFSSWSKNE